MILMQMQMSALKLCHDGFSQNPLLPLHLHATRSSSSSSSLASAMNLKPRFTSPAFPSISARIKPTRFPVISNTLSHGNKVSVSHANKEDRGTTMSPEEFKMLLLKGKEEVTKHIGNCGSVYYQILRLTVKVKHMEKILHKKDKISKRGMKIMLLQRDKMLKNLRSTNFESYCFLLHKLKLRDPKIRPFPYRKKKGVPEEDSDERKKQIRAERLRKAKAKKKRSK